MIIDYKPKQKDYTNSIIVLIAIIEVLTMILISIN